MVEAVFICFFKLLLESFEMREFIVEFDIFVFEEFVLFDEFVEKLVSFRVRV